MKTTLLTALVLLPFMISAQEKPRYEIKSRVINEQIVKLSNCSAVNTTHSEGQTNISAYDYNKGENSYKSVPEYNVTSTASINVVKCQVMEDYTVGITGSFLKWNRKESEIPGSAKRYHQIVNHKKDVSQTESFVDIDSRMMGSTYSLAAETGIEVKVKRKCASEQSSLKELRVELSATECK